MSIYKICPKCNAEHTKNGTYCSKKCANSRNWTDEDKARKSLSAMTSEKLKTSAKNRGNRVNRIVKQCIGCGTDVEVLETHKRDNVTCGSSACILHQKRQAGMSSANSRKNRSQHEIQLFDLVQRHFSNVSHNEPIANGWDADILIHDHRIAILWNGAWHYKQLNLRNHSLEQVVNRDCIKIDEFAKIGWDVLVYQDDVWTPQTALVDILIRLKMVGLHRLEL